ncbi:SUF system Fe-S cluster assembly regulator [Hwanghaeella sp.]|uniref:SUF system Fe-S cluster assembly regulator n=1 Tax=Hwanghaeella sp. TaxID=2605943 RepID=UPI003CCB8D87
MLRLSRLTDYAVVVLSQMAGRSGHVMTALDLAEATALPQPTVAKVLKLLARSEVIESRRGTQGGYVLDRAATEVSVAEIISAIDGPVALTACVDEATGDCSVETCCPMRGRWDRLNTAVQTAFESVSLAEILSVESVPNFIDMPPVGGQKSAPAIGDLE